MTMKEYEACQAMRTYLRGPSKNFWLLTWHKRISCRALQQRFIFSRGTMGKGRGRRAGGLRSASSKDAMQMHEDVLQDDVDAFHASRDKILLDEEQDQDDDEYDFAGDHQEVLGFEPDTDEADRENEEEEWKNENDEDDEEDDGDLDRYQNMILPASLDEDSLFRRAARDEAHHEQEEASDDEDQDGGLGWGRNKYSYYSGNTLEGFDSDSDMDEDKAHELETNEAIRLQRQSRAEMKDDDFGLDAIHAEEAQIAADEQSEAARTKRRRELDAAEADDADELASKTNDELVSLLEHRSPIVLALIEEFRDSLHQLKEESATVEAITEEGETQLAEIAHLYIQSLSNYTMLLSFFFQLASSPRMLTHPESLLTHPVMARLTQFKHAMLEMKNLGLFEPREETVNESVDRVMGAPTTEDAEYEELGDLEPNELQELLADARDEPRSKETSKKKKKSKSQRSVEEPAPNVLADVARVKASDAEPRPKTHSLPSLPEYDDAYGEPTLMHSVERQDKAQRQRAVQFQASALDTKQANKKAAHLEGDADIPYRDKRQIRDAVAAAKSNRLSKSQEPIAEDETAWGDQDWVDDDAEDKDGAEYYDLVSSRKRARKAAQKEEHDQQRLASRVYDDETLAPGDHRAIDYAIDKNKGLTANRPKSIRNPRVKRRMRYDRAKKRLSSTRAVYKGGQSALQGGYGGEASGISTRVVKSRKLGS